MGRAVLTDESTSAGRLTFTGARACPSVTDDLSTFLSGGDEPVKSHFKPLQFGGWCDYQEWVDHDFMSRPGFDGTVTDPADDDAKNVAEEPQAVEDEGLIETVESTEPDNSTDYHEEEFLIRPYVRTRGRASTEYDLRLETMLLTRMPLRELAANLRPTQFSDVGRICALCEVPLSLAELSAYLRAPLGVLRILVGDALSQGLIFMLDNDGDSTGRPSMDILVRVHEGLLRLA
jgi:hypothetical protein